MNVPKPVGCSRSLFVVAKQLLPCRFDVYGYACTRSVIPDDWLNRFSFQPVSNLARGIRLAFDGRIELAFSDHLSVSSAFPIAWHFLVGKFGVSLGNRLRTPTCS